LSATGHLPLKDLAVCTSTPLLRFVAKPLADSFRGQLLEAARKGESFSTEAGLPQSLTRRERHVTCYGHAEEFVSNTWPSAAAKSRISLLETLSVALPVLTRDLTGAPDPDELRLAVRHALNLNEHARRPDAAELRALGWLKRASLPVSALGDPEVTFDLLDTLGRKLDGSPASPDYYSRRLLPAPPGHAPGARLRRTEETPEREPI
jgi:hypothetical protein